mmetsp:Transcript_55212/g.171553  ORF Transcript_55212/g.171553 Transcript_55212/m.171553 type:complete len:328 (+) Transcript_55212:51-1034(+)
MAMAMAAEADGAAGAGVADGGPSAAADGVAAVGSSSSTQGVGASETGEDFREELVERLVAFIKEYYMQGEESVVRSMIRDISEGGRDPRPLGKWGLITQAEAAEAGAAFEAWKSNGYLEMPAKYASKTNKIDIDCIILDRNADGTLKLGNFAGDHNQPILRETADPQLVRHNPTVGWFVPPLPSNYSEAAAAAEAAAGAPYAAASAAAVAAAATPYATASASAAVASTAQFLHAAAPAAAASAPAPSAAAPPEVAPSRVCRASYAFNGTEYGPDYLVLNPGDELVWLEEEQGWARGRVLRRQTALPCGQEGATLDVGWYPANYVCEV